MTPEIIKIDTNTKIKITRYDNGEVISKTAYVNDKNHEWQKHGMDIRWYGDGGKILEIMRRDGKEHGVDMEWYKSGSKHGEKKWKGGKLHGMVSWRDEDGRKESEAYYLRGQLLSRIGWDEEGKCALGKLLAPIGIQRQQNKSNPSKKNVPRSN